MSRLLLNVGNLDVGGWLRGVIGAGISGGSAAITGGVVVSGIDPTDFNFQAHKFWVLVGALFAVNAVVSMAKFLQTTPLPIEKTVTTTTAVTQQGAKPPIVTTTVAETHKETTPAP